MIKDKKGRKWFLRFTQYRQGWHWSAKCEGVSTDSGDRFFTSRAKAEADAQTTFTSTDMIALRREFLRRLVKHGGMPCRFTAEDHDAIARAAGWKQQQLQIQQRMTKRTTKE